LATLQHDILDVIDPPFLGAQVIKLELEIQQRSMMTFDVCIVGAGIIGSALGYDLSRNNFSNVVLLDQFPLPHTRGSSHGQTRVIRHSYGQKLYTEMMPECFEAWKSLEEISGVKLLHQCGLLSIDCPPLKSATKVKRNLDEVGLSSLLVEGTEFREKYPMLKYADGTGGLFEKEAGVLMASKCLKVYQDLFVQNGGRIVDSEKVLKIIPGQVTTLITSNRELKAKNIIITAGAWTLDLTNQLGLQLPLEPIHINVCYWNTTDKRYRADQGFPAFGDFGTGTEKKCQVYGLPCIEYPNMLKICLHHGMKVNPDMRDFVSSLESDTHQIGDYIKEHFENVELKPSIVEQCMYMSTPDDDFIIDRHPKYNNILIGAGFSGHGFKLAPVVGKLLRELLQNKNPSYDIQSFRISRFQQVKSHL